MITSFTSDMAVLDQQRADKIRQCLLGKSRGLTITDLALKTKMNRNLVAKYLDLLLISGQVEMREVGPTKVYFLANRVPISAMLEFSSDFVIVVNEEQTLVQVNEPVLALLNVARENLVGKTITGIDHPFFQSLPVPGPAKTGKPAGETISETNCVINGEPRHFRVRLVPTTFEDGNLGATFIIEDITDRKTAEERIAHYIRNLEFLARTSAWFADMGDDENIYQYIADSLAELEPKARVVVASINPETRSTRMQAFAGDMDWFKMAFEKFGRFLSEDVSLIKAPEVFSVFQQGVLVKGPGDLFYQTYRMFPEQMCNEMQERLSIGNTYAMGCTCRMGLYGNISLWYIDDDDIGNRETVEAFIRQAGVALQRRHLRERLRAAEGQLAKERD